VLPNTDLISASSSLLGKNQSSKNTIEELAEALMALVGLDINSLENSYFESGKGLKEYNWLCENASKFGFCQVYTSKKNSKRTGYEMEKWHWSYLPESTKLLNEYHAKITYADIKGFKGSNLAQKINFIPSFVDGISKKCK
jgi:hypothetical protein